MFNLKKDKIYSFSMARGPRAIMPGNFNAGAKKLDWLE